MLENVEKLTCKDRIKEFLKELNWIFLNRKSHQIAVWIVVEKVKIQDHKIHPINNLS